MNFILTQLRTVLKYIQRSLQAEFGVTAAENPDDFREMFLTKDCGFNEFIVIEGKTLAKICANDTTFEQDFKAYLNGFDPDLRRLLGVGCGSQEQKFLNMDGIAAELRGKKILMQVAAKWAEIDLSPYDNSAITTLEEHIKRKWADISASTAGEQYTPDDIISLMAEIVSDKMHKPKGEIVHVYDPTCGGANLLFGVADRLHEQGKYEHIATYGSEYNDALYALAAIESRFRDFSKIEYGNTLTKVPFSDIAFDAVVANPPYGTPWKGYAKEIANDQKSQFEGGLPAVGDGQFLFMQHILWQLDSKGLAVVVADGSTLFSGDAGSGECNIRKYIFDHDWVEALVQMPQQEFFNTGITTYLWILNKNKPAARRNLVALIDGSKGWIPLKKSKGDKRREMTAECRAAIVQALHNFEPSAICKIFDREYFYYNKQKVFLTELDKDGRFVKESITIKLTHAQLGSVDPDADKSDNILEEADLVDLDPDKAKMLLLRLKAFDWRGEVAAFEDEDGTSYEWDQGRETLVRIADGGKEESLGRGTFTFALMSGSVRGTKSIKVTVGPEITTDYEIIPHHFDSDANKAEIAAFVKKYIFKPCTLGENKVGIELNFNKEFYVPEKLDSVEDILAEIKALDAELKEVVL